MVKSSTVGKEFEKKFENSCGFHGVAVTRVPDGCKQLGRKIVRKKSPWDFVLSFRGLGVAIVDTKTTSKAGLQHSDIEPHQVDEMMKHARNGVIAGYVIEVRGARHEFFFAPASYLYSLIYPSRVRGMIRPDSSTALVSLGAGLCVDVPRLFREFAPRTAGGTLESWR